MVQDSSIRLSGSVIKWINSLRGYFQYKTGITYTMNDMVGYMCAVTDYVLTYRGDILDDNYRAYMKDRVAQFIELADGEKMIEELEEIKEKINSTRDVVVIITDEEGNKHCPICKTRTKDDTCPNCRFKMY